MEKKMLGILRKGQKVSIEVYSGPSNEVALSIYNTFNDTKMLGSHIALTGSKTAPRLKLEEIKYSCVYSEKKHEHIHSVKLKGELA